jgi:polar amino acid transport system substrate-binding protein
MFKRIKALKRVVIALFATVLCILMLSQRIQAQENIAPTAGNAATINIIIPNFWDFRQRPEKPFLNPQKTIRILTDDDYPPLHYAIGDARPTGFSIELIRAACLLLEVPCTVQVRRFDTLLNALNDKAGDVVAAAIPTTLDLRKRFKVTHPYHKTPARFAVRKDWQSWPLTIASLDGRPVAVVTGTAHEAFAQAYMPNIDRRGYADLDKALQALKKAEVDFLFGDSVTHSSWANSQQGDCCTLIGAAFLDSTFFGEGVGFILHQEDDTLRRALDYALHQLAQNGTYAELYLRFFPVGIY